MPVCEYGDNRARGWGLQLRRRPLNSGWKSPTPRLREVDGDIHTNQTSTSSLIWHRIINILIREFAPKQTVADQNALEQFQKQWSTYQKLRGRRRALRTAAGNLRDDGARR